MLFNMNKTYLDMSPVEPQESIGTVSEIPKDMDIFYRYIQEFLPAGKTINDLTPEELEKVKNQYRFDPYKPGVYQGITGFGNMMWWLS